MKTLKKCIWPLVLCFLIAPTHIKAQFINQDALWTVKTASFGDGPRYGYYYVYTLKDSLINDTLYTIFETSGKKYEPDNYSERYALREKKGKVYFRLLNEFSSQEFGTKEHLLYRYNVNVGDSLLLPLPEINSLRNRHWHVQAIDSILIDTIYKKRILLEVPNAYSPGNTQYWIEDIGSTEGPLYFRGISEHEFTTYLECFRINDRGLYGDCTWLNSPTIENPVKIDFSIHNHSNSIKIISPSNECLLTIYSLNGKKVFEQDFRCNQFTHFPFKQKGTFLFEVIAGKNRICKKVRL